MDLRTKDVFTLQPSPSGLPPANDREYKPWKITLLFFYPQENPVLFIEGRDSQHMENKQDINISNACVV